MLPRHHFFVLARAWTDGWMYRTVVYCTSIYYILYLYIHYNTPILSVLILHAGTYACHLPLQYKHGHGVRPSMSMQSQNKITIDNRASHYDSFASFTLVLRKIRYHWRIDVL